jgi:hypothetical protein
VVLSVLGPAAASCPIRAISTMSAARSAMSSPVALDGPADGQSVRDRRSSIGRAFKRLKIAIQKIGGSSRESTPPIEQPSAVPPTIVEGPIDTLEVDDEFEEDPSTAEDVDKRLDQ